MTIEEAFTAAKYFNEYPDKVAMSIPTRNLNGQTVDVPINEWFVVVLFSNGKQRIAFIQKDVDAIENYLTAPNLNFLKAADLAIELETESLVSTVSIYPSNGFGYEVTVYLNDGKQIDVRSWNGWLRFRKMIMEEE